MEPTVEVPEDEYEPPPHVFARLAGALARLFRLCFPGRPEPTRWRYVWQALFVALTFAYLSVPLFRHFPWRFHGDRRWQFFWELQLREDLRSGPASFWRGVGTYGASLVLIGPLREELQYRGLPILIARFAERRLPHRLAKAAVWTIAVCSSLYFAWRHNPIFWALPLPQLTFGALAWWMAWRRGLRYSWIMHMGVNLLVLALTVERVWHARR